MELKLELKDTEWPLEYIDHDRNIARAIVVDNYGYYYFVRAYEVIDDNTRRFSDSSDITKDSVVGNAVVEEIDSIVEQYVLDDIYEWISELPKGICVVKEVMSGLCVNVSGSYAIVEAYLMDDYPDYYDEYREREFEVPEIGYIFER